MIKFCLIDACYHIFVPFSFLKNNKLYMKNCAGFKNPHVRTIVSEHNQELSVLETLTRR